MRYVERPFSRSTVLIGVKEVWWTISGPMMALWLAHHHPAATWSPPFAIFPWQAVLNREAGTLAKVAGATCLKILLLSWRRKVFWSCTSFSFLLSCYLKSPGFCFRAHEQPNIYCIYFFHFSSILRTQNSTARFLGNLLSRP